MLNWHLFPNLQNINPNQRKKKAIPLTLQPKTPEPVCALVFGSVCLQMLAVKNNSRLENLSNARAHAVTAAVTLRKRCKVIPTVSNRRYAATSATTATTGCCDRNRNNGGFATPAAISPKVDLGECRRRHHVQVQDQPFDAVH